MLAQVVVDKGEGSKQPTEPQPTPSPTQPSTRDQPLVTESSSRHDTTQVPKDSLEGTDESKGDQVQSSNDRPHSGVLNLQKAKDAQAAEIFTLKKRIKKLEKKCKPSISHHRAWLKSVQRLSMKKRLVKKESVSKQGRKNAKSKPTLDAFDDLDVDLAHGMDYMEIEEAVNKGRQSNETEELNLDADTEVIAEDKGSGEKREEKAMEKGVAFKDVEDSSRPARSVIKRKDQGIDQIDRDEELAQKLHKEELAEIARIQEEKAAQEEAARVSTMEMFDVKMHVKDSKKGRLVKILQMEEEVLKNLTRFETTTPEGVDLVLLGDLRQNVFEAKTKKHKEEPGRIKKDGILRARISMKIMGSKHGLSMDDLYNNLKIYEAEVMGSSSTSQNTQNIAFVSSNITGSTNEAVKNAHGVFATNSKANASTLPNVDSLSDGDGLEVTDGNADNESKDISQEDRKESRNRETTRRTVPVKETTSNALVSQCDGFGYDWSDQAKEGPTNFALMAYTSLSSSSSSILDTKVNDKYKTGEGYHAVPPPYTGN
ncbi:hypothetical protein Tco_0356301, partial [Tanacetum coccineum]